jgi:hypothetical protein
MSSVPSFGRVVPHPSQGVEGVPSASRFQTAGIAARVSCQNSRSMLAFLGYHTRIVSGASGRVLSARTEMACSMSAGAKSSQGMGGAG